MEINELVTKADLQATKDQILQALQVQLTPKSTKRWLRSAEVIDILGLSLSGLQNLRINGTLPYSRLGGTIYYDYTEIERLLETNRTNAKSLPAQ